MVRPAILCGLDFLALGFARGLLADRRLTTADKTGLRLFDFVTQSHADFRSVLDKLTAEAQDRGLEPTPHIVLLTSTFGENSTRVVDHLKEISRTLRLALPGNQQITLVGVMPRVANTERKIEMFRFFQQLEGFVSQIPFLSTIFLHELSADPGNQEGLTSETKPEVDLETCQDVQEFLFRELLEADFRGEIDRLGSSAVGSGITALGRLCCFSSLGAHVLWFPRERILDYLRTRFQCEVFDRGLADAGSLSEKELESVQNRVDALIKALVAKLDQEISAGGQISVRASDLEHLDQLDRWETELVNEISKSAELAGSRGASTRTLSKERIRSDFLDFFHQAPRYLAGMQSYEMPSVGGD